MERHPITLNFATFLQKARQIDLAPIAYQLIRSATGPRWTEAQTVKAITRYLAFLYLADVYPQLRLVPSAEIDCVWHHHILDTSKYAEDCQRLFGHLIHHFPYSGLRGEWDRIQQVEAYALTQKLLREHFGEYFSNELSPAADCEPLASTCQRLTAQTRPGIVLIWPEAT